MLFGIFALVPSVYASTDGHTANLFLWIALLLIVAKISSLAVERIQQPAVLGELLIGVLLGNLGLFGIHYFDSLKTDEVLAFLAQLGVVLLLFKSGLETNVDTLLKVGIRAFLVACLGVIVPFGLAYFLTPLILPNLSQNTYLFLGATLTATSVGITSRVFKDLGKLNTAEAQIVLGAAVIDDVMGLVILAVVSAIVTTGTVSAGEVSWITLKAGLFLVGAIVIGQWTAAYIGNTFSKIHAGESMKFTIVICFGLIFAYLAHLVGLAPIVGAFAAGLVLDKVQFEEFDDTAVHSDIQKAVVHADMELKQRVENILEKHRHHHIENLIDPLGHFLIPLFFVLTGMQVNLHSFTNIPILMTALAITALAFISKLVAGLAAGKVNKWIVGWGMAPRGEVGLIFAMTGKGLGVINDDIFAVIVIMITLTTLLTPPILGHLLRKMV
jgi:Kef-type K+ transport system membrane component KefB